ncbi:MAG: ACP S-malonyltransferase [Aquificaceae bacterium]
MSGSAFVFPGQGSQYVGMGYDFYKEHHEASDVFHQAEMALRYNLTDIIFKGPEEELNRTVNTQPAILTVSYAIYSVLKAYGLPEPVFVSGHSLGEYTALTVAKGVEFFEAVRLAYLRGKYMQESVQEEEGAMAAVLKLPPEKVEEACALARDEGVVEPANYNSPEQTVISGQKRAVKKALQIAEAMGGRAILLKVSVPSHCSLMRPAADAFRLKLAQTPIKNLSIPLVQNYSAKDYTIAHEVRENLYRQFFSPVRWYQSILYMVERGVDTFIEIGPKNVLTRLIEKTVPSVRVFNVGKIEDVERIREVFKR